MATSHLPRRSDVAVHVAISHWPKGNLVTKFVRFQKRFGKVIRRCELRPEGLKWRPGANELHDYLDDIISLNRKRFEVELPHAYLSLYLDPGVRSGDGPDSPVVGMDFSPQLVKGKWVAPMDKHCRTLRLGLYWKMLDIRIELCVVYRSIESRIESRLQ
ncbi:hypothetical protein Bca4012_026720 [Brassica carinata]